MPQNTLLFVDDEVSIRDMLNDTFKKYNFKTYTASNGEEALQVYKEHQDEIQLINLDIMMPVMDGIATYHNIRAINKNVPIIFFSGWHQANEVQTLLDRDLNLRFRGKPYSYPELAKLINRLLGNNTYMNLDAEHQ